MDVNETLISYLNMDLFHFGQKTEDGHVSCTYEFELNGGGCHAWFTQFRCQ